MINKEKVQDINDLLELSKKIEKLKLEKVKLDQKITDLVRVVLTILENEKQNVLSIIPNTPVEISQSHQYSLKELVEDKAIRISIRKEKELARIQTAPYVALLKLLTDHGPMNQTDISRRLNRSMASIRLYLYILLKHNRVVQLPGKLYQAVEQESTSDTQ